MMTTSRRPRRPLWARPLRSPALPRSLRGQFTLALSMLSLLILAGSLAAFLSLRTSTGATLQLTQDRLGRMQGAQDVVQRTLLIEHDSDRLLSTRSLAAVQQSYAAIVTQTKELDRLVAGLASEHDDLVVLDLLQSAQLFRNTANVVAQLRERALQSEIAFTQLLQQRTRGLQGSALALVLYRLQSADDAGTVEQLRGQFLRSASALHAMPLEGDPFTARLRLINERQGLGQFNTALQHQADSMVAAARLQSASFDGDYRVALQQLADTSRRHQHYVLLLLAGNLLFVWAVGYVFLGRHLLRRLQQLSHHLQQRGEATTPLHVLALGKDEIGDMARAVDQFLADRSQLETRTAELTRTQEHLVQQGQVLEMIATGAPLTDILDQLTRLVESEMPGITGSILLLDQAGVHLRHGAGPSLPPAYTQAIDGVRIGPCVGSCGTAAWRGEAVIVTDIQTDPLWADFRALAALHGLRSCWSSPILSQEGAVLGTFAMYSPAVSAPAAPHLRLIELGTRIAGIAIERRRSEERIGHMAHHDDLTGLPNRALLDDRLAQALVQARRIGSRVALLFMDLDGFKFINDSFGHAVGDATLRAVAARLSGVLREGDTVARLGGDEFVLMLVDLDRAEDAAQVAQKILAALAQPLLVNARSLHVSGSIGVSVYPDDGATGEQLLRHADVAMYRAKQRGHGAYQCYTEDMGLQAREHLELKVALRQALEQGEFELQYQPQVDLKTGHVSAMEALIRWHHPVLGMVSPGRFIPLAEETGLIVPIGEWVLRTACAQLKAWHEAGHVELCVSVNVSARQFQGHDVAAVVRQVLGECGLKGESLELELTESALMLDTDIVLQTLRDLKSTGVQLALDDFGTGYSSLSHLKRFPIDVLKIDQSFTFDLTASAEAASITRAIIAMARSLDMATVAEGVETVEQFNFMVEHQCDRVQGYYFSRPLSVAAMSALLAQDAQHQTPQAV
jgi:diguanylate cyclase (GGDEF)-like protein